MVWEGFSKDMTGGSLQKARGTGAESYVNLPHANQKTPTPSMNQNCVQARSIFFTLHVSHSFTPGGKLYFSFPRPVGATCHAAPLSQSGRCACTWAGWSVQSTALFTSRDPSSGLLTHSSDMCRTHIFSDTSFLLITPHDFGLFPRTQCLLARPSMVTLI